MINEAIGNAKSASIAIDRLYTLARISNFLTEIL